MVTATFMFRQHRSDAEFERLNAAIAAFAESIQGYLGRKKWQDEDGNLAVVYYWESHEALERLRAFPVHLEAKRRYGEWYDGYRIEIGEIVSLYGDGGFPQLPGGDGSDGRARSAAPEVTP